jgi:radical SAM-linked protein
MKFVGHLDMMRFFQKAVRRAGLNVAYSAGYSPHQLMSFAAPLGVGLTSKGEYLDVELACELDAAGLPALHKSLAAQMVAGVEIVAVALLSDTAKNAMASVAAAGYTVEFRENANGDDNADTFIVGAQFIATTSGESANGGADIAETVDWYSQFEQFLQSPHIIYTKRNKKGERTLDLKPLIYEAAPCLENRGLYLLLDASSANSIKPQFVVEAYFDYLGQYNHSYSSAPEYTVCREDIYTRTETGEFVPLIWAEA